MNHKRLLIISLCMWVAIAIVGFTAPQTPTVSITPTLTLSNLTEFPISPQDGTIAYVDSQLFIYVDILNDWKKIKFFNSK